MTRLVRKVLGVISCVTRKEECSIWRNVMTSDPCKGHVLHMSNRNSLPNLWKPRKGVRGQVLVPVAWPTLHPRPGTDIIVVITVQSWVDPRVDLVKRKMLFLLGSRTATLQTPLNYHSICKGSDYKLHCFVQHILYAGHVTRRNSWK